MKYGGGTTVEQPACFEKRLPRRVCACQRTGGGGRQNVSAGVTPSLRQYGVFSCCRNAAYVAPPRQGRTISAAIQCSDIPCCSATSRRAIAEVVADERRDIVTAAGAIDAAPPSLRTTRADNATRRYHVNALSFFIRPRRVSPRRARYEWGERRIIATLIPASNITNNLPRFNNAADGMPGNVRHYDAMPSYAGYADGLRRPAATIDITIRNTSPGRHHSSRSLPVTCHELLPRGRQGASRPRSSSGQLRR